MKNAKWMLPVTLLLLSGLMAAQSPASSKVEANTATFTTSVPFPFVVGNQILPAGSYQIQRLLGHPNHADEIGMIVVRSADPRIYKAVVTMLVENSSPSHDNPRLVFTVIANQHYLAEVWMKGEKSQAIPGALAQSDAFGADAPRSEIVLAALR